MLTNYKMTIAYDGSRYYGWEHQPGKDLTIQGKLEQVLSRLAGKKTDITGAGRTDAGVHARGMVANARLDVNSFPPDILQEYFPEVLTYASESSGYSSYMHKYISDGIKRYMNR